MYINMLGRWIGKVKYGNVAKEKVKRYISDHHSRKKRMQGEKES